MSASYEIVSQQSFRYQSFTSVHIIDDEFLITVDN